MTISNLFLSATFFVLCFVIFGNAQGTYLEHAQVPLYGIIFTEIVLILINRIFRNPLLDIVNLMLIIFFLLRVPFVYGDGLISDIYRRNVNIDNINHAIYVLNFELVILSACILFVKPARAYHGVLVGTNELFHRVLMFTMLILLLNCIYVFFFHVLGVNNLPSVIQIFIALFNWGSILILLVPLLLLVDKNISIKYRMMLYVQLTICVLIVMYTGSKSGLFQIFGIFLMSLIAIHGASYRIAPRGLLIAFVLLFVAIIMYLLGDISNKIQRAQVDSSDWLDLLNASLDNLFIPINSVSFRIGYLDFYIDKLTQEVYASAFQLKYYIMAFIDGVTPGFTAMGTKWNVPLVSRAVYNNYFGMSEGPNSEVITVFAEAHRLAGYLSFIIYLFVLWIILLVRKYCFDLRSNYGRYMQSIFACFIFYQYMLGMGIDYWLFGDVIYPLIFVTISLKFIERRRSKQPNVIAKAIS